MKNYIYVPGLSESVDPRASEKSMPKQEIMVEAKKEQRIIHDRNEYRVKNIESRDYTVPLWERYALSISEASEYFGIGRDRLKEFIESNPDANFTLRNGNRLLIKRKLFESYLDKLESILEDENEKRSNTAK